MTDILESVDLIDPWLYATLANDATLQGIVGDRIVNTQSNVDVSTPYIVFNAANTRAIRGLGGVLLDTNSLYNIKAVTQSGSFTQANSVAKRIRALLDRKNVTTASPLTTVPATIASRWETEIRYPEVSEGVWYQHLGGVYRIEATVL